MQSFVFEAFVEVFFGKVTDLFYKIYLLKTI